MDGTRVVATSRLKALKFAVRTYAWALAEDNKYRVAASVDDQLRHNKLTADKIFGEYTSAGHREPKKL